MILRSNAGPITIVSANDGGIGGLGSGGGIDSFEIRADAADREVLVRVDVDEAGPARLAPIPSLSGWMNNAARALEIVLAEARRRQN